MSSAAATAALKADIDAVCNFDREMRHYGASYLSDCPVNPEKRRLLRLWQEATRPDRDGDLPAEVR